MSMKVQCVDLQMFRTWSSDCLVNRLTRFRKWCGFEPDFVYSFHSELQLVGVYFQRYHRWWTLVVVLHDSLVDYFQLNCCCGWYSWTEKLNHQQVRRAVCGDPQKVRCSCCEHCGRRCCLYAESVRNSEGYSVLKLKYSVKI